MNILVRKKAMTSLKTVCESNFRCSMVRSTGIKASNDFTSVLSLSRYRLDLKLKIHENVLRKSYNKNPGYIQLVHT